MLSLRLLSFHNLHFYLSLTRNAREAIINGTYAEFKKSFIQRYTANQTQP